MNTNLDIGSIVYVKHSTGDISRTKITELIFCKGFDFEKLSGMVLYRLQNYSGIFEDHEFKERPQDLMI